MGDDGLLADWHRPAGMGSRVSASGYECNVPPVVDLADVVFFICVRVLGRCLTWWVPYLVDLGFLWLLPSVVLGEAAGDEG